MSVASGGGGDSNEPSYQTIRGNPLRSFAQMAGAPPSTNGSLLDGSGVNITAFSMANNGDGFGRARTAHIVRPVVIASPNLRSVASGGGKSPGMIGNFDMQNFLFNC